MDPLADPEITTLLRRLERVQLDGSVFDKEFLEELRTHPELHDALVDACCAVGVLFMDDVIALRERWKARFGERLGILDLVIVEAFTYEQARVKAVLTMMRREQSGQTEH